MHFFIKFIYSEKATKFCEIFTLLLSVCTVDKSKAKILKFFLAFSEYMNFNELAHLPHRSSTSLEVGSNYTLNLPVPRPALQHFGPQDLLGTLKTLQ